MNIILPLLNFKKKWKRKEVENKEALYNITQIGLTEEDIKKIHAVFACHNNIKKVILYGSRAMGNFKPSSDIDLSIVGEGVDLTQLNEIENQLDDLLLPYKIDLSIFHQIENMDFLAHINRVGKIFYLS